MGSEMCIRDRSSRGEHCSPDFFFVSRFIQHWNSDVANNYKIANNNIVSDGNIINNRNIVE